MRKKAIFICGPTAVGKTSVAIEIAKWLNTEIVSFDSRQFFKELKIGAAPPSSTELAEVKHHFIGQLSVTEDFSAGEFEAKALKVLNKLWENQDHVVLVGGSGMYMKALTDGFDEMPEVKESTRNQLNKELKHLGLEPLQKELQEKDSAYYESVDLNNPQRLIRALEIIRETGQTYSSFRKRKGANRHFDIIKIGLNLDREDLYARINLRVDKMVEMGLVEEVKSLLPYRDKNSLQTVGYREVFPYLDGDCTLDEAIEEVKKNSRRYAKRQLTWFRREENMNWFEPTQIDSIKNFISEGLELK